MLTFSEFVVIDPSKGNGPARSATVKHRGSRWFPVFTVTDSHTGFALYCRTLTSMTTTWFMHEYCSISILVKLTFLPRISYRFPGRE